MSGVFIDVGLEALLRNTTNIVEGRTKHSRASIALTSNYPELKSPPKPTSTTRPNTRNNASTRPQTNSSNNSLRLDVEGDERSQLSTLSPLGPKSSVGFMDTDNFSLHSMQSMQSMQSMKSVASSNTMKTDASSLQDVLHQFVDQQTSKAPRKIAGYQPYKTESFTELARQLLKDPKSKQELFSSPDFVEAYERVFQSSSMRSDPIFRNIELALDDPSLANPYDDFMVEYVSVVLAHIEQEEHIHHLQSKAMMKQETDTMRLVQKTKSEEDLRVQRISQLASKTLEARLRIQQTAEADRKKSEDKIAAIEAHMIKFTEAKKNSMLSSRDTLLKSEKEKIEIAQRKEAIAQEAEERVAEQLYKYELQAEKLSKLLSAQMDKIKAKAAVRDKRIHDRKSLADKQDREFRDKAITTIQQKDELYSMQKQRIDEQVNQRLVSNKDREKRMKFMAEQRRKLKEEQKQADLELLEFQQQKLDHFQSLRQVVNADRPNTVQQIFKENFQSKDPPPLEVSPGPGAYNLRKPTKVVGGPIGGAILKSCFDKESITPAPHTYQNNNYSARNVIRGALPFAGRGKTHTDWIILAASKLPSVGDHNVDEAEQSLRNTNAVQFSARGTTDIDIKIRRASTLPGVGQYDITSSPVSLRQSTKLNLANMDNNSSAEEGESASVDAQSINSGSRSAAPQLSPLISPTARLQRLSSKMFRSPGRDQALDSLREEE